MATTDNPLFLEAEVDSENLKKSVTRAEKSMNMMFEAMMKAAEGIETTDEASSSLGESTKKTAKEIDKSTESTKKRITAGKLVVGALKRESNALSALGISWSSIASAIGGATIVGLLGKALKDFLEFDKAIRTVSTAFSGQNKLIGTASSMIQGLNGYLYTTEAELINITKAMGEFGMVRDNTAKGAALFRRITMDVIHLGASMDVSKDSVVRLFDTFTRVYGLPHHRLRNISSAMKSIQESTSISGQELISFASTLSNVLSRMTNTTELGAEKATVDLMAMAGALKDMGVQPEKVSQMFGEAMKVHSAQGAKFLAFITQHTNKSSSDVRAMMESGDFKTPFTMLLKRIKREGPKWLKQNELWVTSATQLTHAELRNMQKSAIVDYDKFFNKHQLAAKKGKKAAEAAAKRQNAISKTWFRVKRALNAVWMKIGGILAKLATALIKYLDKPLTSLIKKITLWLKSGKGIDKWVENVKIGAKQVGIWLLKLAVWWYKNEVAIKAWVKNAAIFVYNWIKDKLIPEFKRLLMKGQDVISWWGSLSDTEKSIVKWAAAVAAAFALVGGKLTLIVASVTAAVVGFKYMARAMKYIAEERMKPAIEMQKLREKAANLGTKSDRKVFNRIDITRLAKSMKHGSASSVKELMDLGVIDSKGRVIANSSLVGGDKNAKSLQRIVDNSLKYMAAMNKAAGDPSLGAKTPEGVLKAASKVDLSTAPPAEVETKAPPLVANVKVSTDSPKQEQLLGEIRDAMLRMANKPSKGVTSRLLSGELG